MTPEVYRKEHSGHGSQVDFQLGSWVTLGIFDFSKEDRLPYITGPPTLSSEESVFVTRVLKFIHLFTAYY